LTASQWLIILVSLPHTVAKGGFAMEQEKHDQVSGRVMTRLDGLEARLQALEYRRQRGIWIERVMNWLIIIGLVVAVIIFALSQ